MMSAGWLALEEIKADAGRFFICSNSHKTDVIKQDVANNVVDYHKEYVLKIVSLIKSKNLVVKAPYMGVGDFLLWNSRTIHGSLNSQSNKFSRSSITWIYYWGTCYASCCKSHTTTLTCAVIFIN